MSCSFHFSSRPVLAAIFAIGALSCFAAASRGDSVTFTVSFGMPNEVLVQGPGTPNGPNGEGDVWTVTDTNSVFGGAGPTQFHPEWGTLNSVRLEMIGSIDVEWDVSNPDYGWFNPGGFGVTVGFGDPGNDEDTQYAAAVPNSDSGILHAGLHVVRDNLNINDFIGNGSYVVLLHSELSFGFQGLSNTGFDDPMAGISGAAQGVFVGQIIVTYDYTPNP